MNNELSLKENHKTIKWKRISINNAIDKMINLLNSNENEDDKCNQCNRLYYNYLLCDTHSDFFIYLYKIYKYKVNIHKLNFIENYLLNFYKNYTRKIFITHTLDFCKLRLKLINIRYNCCAKKIQRCYKNYYYSPGNMGMKLAKLNFSKFT